MTLFETLILVILLVTISHIAVGFITYAFISDFTIFCPKDFWEMTRGRWFATTSIYLLYVAFAPIFGLIGLVVWVFAIDL